MSDDKSTLAEAIAKKAIASRSEGDDDKAKEEMGAELLDAFKGGDAKRLMKVLDNVIRARKG